MRPSQILCALIAAFVACAGFPVAAVAAPADAAAIAQTVKADVAQLVVDLNAHDAAAAASHDAPDVVAMESGQANIIGAAADQESDIREFASDPNWKFAISDPKVDVAACGDMAVYRAAAARENTRSGVRQAANLVAGYKRQPAGSWKMAWYVVSALPAAEPAAGR